MVCVVDHQLRYAAIAVMTLARSTLRHSATVDFRSTMSSRSYRPCTFEISTATAGTSTNAQVNAMPQQCRQRRVTKSAASAIGTGQGAAICSLAPHRLTDRFEQLDVVIVFDRLGGEKAPILDVFWGGREHRFSSKRRRSPRLRSRLHFKSGTRIRSPVSAVVDGQDRPIAPSPVSQRMTVSVARTPSLVRPCGTLLRSFPRGSRTGRMLDGSTRI